MNTPQVWHQLYLTENNGAPPRKQEIVMYKRCSAENMKYDITDQVVYEQQQVSSEYFHRYTLVVK